jgi:steroid delta-isomerase-like uncharacterized protein
VPTRSDASATFDAVQCFFTAFDDHEVAAMIALCTKDATVRFVPMGEEGEGTVQTLGTAFWSALFSAIPDVRAHVRSIFGDMREVATEVVIEGTQQREFEHITNLGHHFVLPHAFLFRFTEDTKVTSVAIYWDNVTLFSQLGKTTLTD